MTSLKFQMQNSLDAVDQTVVQLDESVRTELQDITLMRFSICVSEALTNLVLHSKTTDKNAPIDIVISIQAENIQVDIFDPLGAPFFDPTLDVTLLENVDIMSENGRGRGILVESTDEIEYGQVNKRNRLKLTFYKTSTA